MLALSPLIALLAGSRARAALRGDRLAALIGVSVATLGALPIVMIL